MRLLTLDPDFDATEPVRGLAFAADGSGLAAVVGEAGAAEFVCRWDLRADTLLSREPTDVGSGLDAYADPAVAPDLPAYAYHTYEETAETSFITVADMRPGGRSVQLGGDDERYRVRCLGFTPDGRQLLAGVTGAGFDTVIARWDVERLFSGGVQAATVAEEEPVVLDGRPTALACDPAGRLLAVGLAAGRATLFDLATSSERRSFRVSSERLRDQPARQLAVSPDGSRLAVRWGKGGTVTVWDATPGGPGRPLAEVAPDGKRLTGMTFAPDGRTLAVSSADGTVAFYDAVTFEERQRFAWRAGPLHSVAFAPDGLTCAAGGDRGRVVVWDVE